MHTFVSPHVTRNITVRIALDKGYFPPAHLRPHVAHLAVIGFLLTER